MPVTVKNRRCVKPIPVRILDLLSQENARVFPLAPLLNLLEQRGLKMEYLFPEQGKLLRIFIGESDRWHHQPLYEAIVLKARELGLAGATVLRGPMGFGANSRLHTAKILRLSMDLPMVIEIVDTDEKIQHLLPHLEEMVMEGLVTLEDVQVLKYRANQEKPRT